MAGCFPQECDHHCARVCRQYACTCDYHPGYTSTPQDQRICCQWELIHRPRSSTYAYTDNDARIDTLTRYFSLHRSLRDPHDPVRFTGINHVPGWLHADLSSLDMDYSNILKEREITAASRYFGPREYRPLRSIRPCNKSDTLESDERFHRTDMSKKDEEEIRRGKVKGKISSQGLRNGQMPFLD